MAAETTAPESAKARAAYWLSRMRDNLYKSVLPFWMRHSIDADNGGFFDCLDEDGSVYDTRKHVWLQGRQTWMLAKVANTVTPAALSERSGGALTHAAVRSAALSGARFLHAHARLPPDPATGERYVAFCLTADGRVVQVQRKIFSACFVLLGLSEASRSVLREGSDSSGEERVEAEAWRTGALEMLEDVLRWAKDGTLLGRPVCEGDTPMSPLNVPMILLNLFDELGVTGDKETEVAWCVAEINKHIKPDLKLCLENVGTDAEGSLIDNPDGRIHTPGHAIECAWFLLDWAEKAGDAGAKDTALSLMDWSFDAGWDTEHGGLFYFLDSSGRSPVPLEWSMKLWWPHCEALVAYALAYKVSGSDAHMERFNKVATYTFKHFVDESDSGGEWYGYLDRRNEVTHRFKGGPYKGCFHVPRALLFCERLLSQAVEA